VIADIVPGLMLTGRCATGALGGDAPAHKLMLVYFMILFKQLTVGYISAKAVPCETWNPM